MRFTNRLDNLPEYITGKLKQRANAMLASGETVYDFTLGDPDWTPEESVKYVLHESIEMPGYNGYKLRGAAADLRRAISDWYARHYGVAVDSENEIEIGIGSKALCHECDIALVPTGSKVLVPSPCYPITTEGVQIVGGVPVPYYVGPSNDLVGDVMRAFEENPHAVGIKVNFPHNPTGRGVELSFYEWLVRYATDNDIWVIADTPYGFTPLTPSILTVDGAKDVAVELNSLSKRQGMAGFRIGWMAGNPEMVRRMVNYHSRTQYGTFGPMYPADTFAVDHGDDNAVRNWRLVHRRLQILVDGLTEAGWPGVTMPVAETMYLWPEIPPQFQDMGSLAFTEMLLEKTGVLFTPGIAFGQDGDRFVRIAAVKSEGSCKNACELVSQIF